MDEEFHEQHYDAAWRRPAPRARALAMALYGWGRPGSTATLSLLVGLLFAAASALSPALLSLGAATSLIAPIADARALFSGNAEIASAPSPLYSSLLMAAGAAVDPPGRIHLLAKALGAALIALSAALLLSARLPFAAALLATGALAALAAAPFAGPADLGLALLLVFSTALLAPPPRDSSTRAVSEGAMIGAGLTALWLLSPIMPLAALLVVAAAPWHSRFNFLRTLAAAVAFCLAAAALDALSPGLNATRLDVAVAQIAGGAGLGASLAWSAGAAASAAIVILAAAVFGGRKHWRGWASALVIAAAGLGAAYVAGANPTPVYVAAALIAALSPASPFSAGVTQQHDRASVSLALIAGALALFWAGAQILTAGGQLLFQFEAAKSARADIRDEWGLIQPGGATLTQWIAEGRVAAGAQARAALASTPVDQSAALMDAANQARALTKRGVAVSILTGADTACVIVDTRPCAADGPRAAAAADIVFEPRLDIDRATMEARQRAQAMLYTEFRLAERTALWDIWVRRKAKLPSEIAERFAPLAE